MVQLLLPGIRTFSGNESEPRGPTRGSNFWSLQRFKGVTFWILQGRGTPDEVIQKEKVKEQGSTKKGEAVEVRRREGEDQSRGMDGTTYIGMFMQSGADRSQIDRR